MKLYLLQLALFQPLGIPVPAYVIQTDDGINILIDSGLPISYINNPPPPTGARQFQIQMRPEDSIISRLASIGLKPSDIRYLVCTHLDPDHSGNHDLFPTAEFIIQKKHYEAAKAGHVRAARTRDHWDIPALRYRQIEGDTKLVPGVELIESTGHVPGHQSVLVRLPHTGPVLLAIDAIPAASMLNPDTRAISPNDDNEADTRASTRKLTDLARREGVKLIIHGHDPQQWPTLKHAPSFYD